MNNISNKYLVERINKQSSNIIKKQYNAFIGTWKGESLTYTIKNEINEIPVIHKVSSITITISPVIDNAFFRIHIVRKNESGQVIVDLINTLMYNDGYIIGQMNINDYTIIYFDENGMIENFQNITINNDKTETLYGTSRLIKSLKISNNGIIEQ